MRRDLLVSYCDQTVKQLFVKSENPGAQRAGDATPVFFLIGALVRVSFLTFPVAAEPAPSMRSTASVLGSGTAPCLGFVGFVFVFVFNTDTGNQTQALVFVWQAFKDSAISLTPTF